MANARPRVVVLGAGFAGLAACGLLAKAPVDVLLVNRHTYNTFQPLLYQVATAGLNPGDIAFPVRSFTRRHPNIDFRLATATSVDFASRRVHFDDDGSAAYDFLILATGAATNFFGVAGAAENSRGIYTMEDAVAVRDDITVRFEHAAAHGAEPGEMTTVIVGGGATGVEMAGTLAELRDVALEKTYKGVDKSAARIILVEQRSSLLGGFHRNLGEYADKQLSARGVEVRYSTSVKEVGASKVVLEPGGELACGVVIWAAGVGPGPLTQSLDVPKAKGRIEVGPDLQLVDHKGVFAAGDVAIPPQVGAAEPLPQLAQPAIQEGRHAALQVKRIIDGRPTEPFKYHDKGTMATIGRRAAVAQLAGGLRLKGTPAWFAWLALHIVFLLGFRNRAAVLLNWAWRYASWRRGPRVVAGP